MQKMLLIATLLCCSGQACALPTIFLGDQVTLRLADFTEISQFYKTENGINKYAVTAYETEFETYGTTGLSRLNFELTGDVAASWRSSNFAITTELYCGNSLISNDFYEGIRYQNVSYLVKPSIVKPNHPIPQGCSRLKIRLLKAGSLSRQYFTRITDIQLRMYLTADF